MSTQSPPTGEQIKQTLRTVRDAAAQVVLGHSKANTTEIDAEKNEAMPLPSPR